MKTSKKYTKELKKQFGYFATWLPGTPLELGDIGVMKRNQFTKISNLEDLGIQFEIEIDNSGSDIDHSSKGAVSVTTKAAGTVSPTGSSIDKVDAGITVEFSKENAILFRAKNTKSPSIKDQIALGQQILLLYKEGKWDKDWAVITELVEAESGTIIISSSSKGKVELKAKGEVQAANIDIADANIGLELSYSKDLSTTIIAKESMTPLFKASKVNGRMLKSPVFGINRINSMDLITPDIAKKDENAILFAEVELDEDEAEM